MKYNFDKIINRHNTNALSVEGFKNYLFTKNDSLAFTCLDEEFITMWVADMEFSTAPEIIDALKKRVEHGIFGYTKLFDANYKKSFLNWAKSRYEWEINSDYIVTSNGVVPALYDLIDYICKPKDKIITLTPSYAFFKHAAVYNDMELVMSHLICNEGYYTIDFEDFRSKVSDEKVTLFILCSPHNPTGRIWTNDELITLAEICFENNVTIISDEIHCDLLRTGNTFTPLSKLFPSSNQIITCMAASKTFNLAGFNLANIVIPDDNLRAKWIKKHHTSQNPLSLVAVQTAFTEGQEWLSELSSYLDQNFNYLSNYLSIHLPKAVFNIPQATYLAWIDLSAYFAEEENLTLFFANNAGVLLEGGNMFVANANGYVRLNLACPKSRLEEGLKKIAEAINNKEKQ